MIPKRAIHNDIHVEWSVSVNGGHVALGECEDVRTEIILPNGTYERVPHKLAADGRSVQFDLPGKRQCLKGVYGLRLWFRHRRDGQACIEKADAFELDSVSDEAVHTQYEAQHLQYRSAITIGIRGPKGAAMRYEDLTAEQKDELRPKLSNEDYEMIVNEVLRRMTQSG